MLNISSLHGPHAFNSKSKCMSLIIIKCKIAKHTSNPPPPPPPCESLRVRREIYKISIRPLQSYVLDGKPWWLPRDQLFHDATA